MLDTQPDTRTTARRDGLVVFWRGRAATESASTPANGDLRLPERSTGTLLGA